MQQLLLKKKRAEAGPSVKAEPETDILSAGTPLEGASDTGGTATPRAGRQPLTIGQAPPPTKIDAKKKGPIAKVLLLKSNKILA